ncbi:hypothetical protein ONO86_03380 [Micromonospora noduli]|nr:hypothetical protein ONO86_03380 [Micromonospora noduli]
MPSHQPTTAATGTTSTDSARLRRAPAVAPPPRARSSANSERRRLMARLAASTMSPARVARTPAAITASRVRTASIWAANARNGTSTPWVRVSPVGRLRCITCRPSIIWSSSRASIRSTPSRYRQLDWIGQPSAARLLRGDCATTPTMTNGWPSPCGSMIRSSCGSPSQMPLARSTGRNSPVTTSGTPSMSLPLSSVLPMRSWLPARRLSLRATSTSSATSIGRSGTYVSLGHVPSTRVLAP